jgi:hypothetical protein
MGGEDKCMMTYSNAVMQNFLYELEIKTSGIIDSKDMTVAFDIFPDPARDEININLPAENGHLISIEIQDINGVKFSSLIGEYGKNDDGIITINIGDLTPGIYLCQVKIEGKMAVKKFIKQ